MPGFETRRLTAPGVKTSAGVELRGTGGTLWAERYVQKIGYQYTPNGKFSQAPAHTAPGTGASAEGLVRNWLECIRSRRQPVADAEEAYYSTVACFMAAQAFRTQSRVVWDRRWDLPG